MHSMARRFLVAGLLVAIASTAASSLPFRPGVVVREDAGVVRASLRVGKQVTVLNGCRATFVIALRYLTGSKRWDTTGFFEVRAGGRKDAPMRTFDSEIYYYAESMSSPTIKWSGDFSQKIEGKTYLMKRTRLRQHGEDYQLKLTCT